ncbi:hypothetical protein LFX15_18755 [Leptospira levettii]|uniref:hypothetical protein n=1 Tax=Leptospira levettii TaxID=2023178 RepID=UPI001EEC2D0C|nr:hypothetical protein [Leptospira levettii]MCG6150344.1 hypothetical protein [Leptospira levettii]
MDFYYELITYSTAILLWNLFIAIISYSFNYKRSILIDQYAKRIKIASKILNDSWLTGITAYFIFFLFMYIDFVANNIKAFSSFKDIAVRKKPRYYIYLIDIQILILISITYSITLQFSINEIKIPLFIYIIWRVTFHIITNLQLTFESFLSKTNYPDTQHLQARTLVFWILSIIEISIIYSWNKSESFSIKNLISYISIENTDISNHVKIEVFWFQLLAFLQVTAFFGNLKNIPQTSDL